MEKMHGPWRLNPGTGQVHTAPAPGRPHGAVVASVGHHSGFAERDVIGPLIAAAPELLEALEALLHEAWNNMSGGAGHILDDARAAIAKAKGNAS